MTMSRSITFVSCYFSICYLVNGCISQNSIFSNEKEDEASSDSKNTTESIITEKSVTTRSALSMEAQELLELEGMENAGSDVKRFVKKHIIEKKNHKAELSQKDRRIGALQNEKKYESKYRVALTARSRIAYLENDLWPKNKNKPKTRAERWVIILNSGNPEVSTIRDEVLMKYDPNDPQKSIRMFSECLRQIYKTESDDPSHGETDSETLSMLRNGSRSDRLKAMDVLRIPHDPKFLTALEIISMEVPIPTGNDVFQDSVANYSCVEMTPTKGKFPAKLNITEQDVMEFFPTSSGIKSVEINCDRNMDSHSIKVEFDHVNIAVEAFNNNHAWLKREKMLVRLIPC